jgi:diguanylate cyclase (GGDEF)-like protein
MLRPLLVVLLGVSFTALTWYYTDLAERTEAARELKLRSARHVVRLRDALDATFAPLGFVAGLGADSGVDAGRLRRMLDGALPGATPLRYLAWAPRLVDAELPAWEAARQAQHPGFRVARLDGGPMQAGQSHVVVELVWPDERQPDLQGLDLASDPVRAATFERALAAERASVALSARIDLLAAAPDEGRSGLMACVPVYDDGLPLRTADERRAALKGFVVAECAANLLIATAFAPDTGLEGEGSICIEVWDEGGLLGAVGDTVSVDRPFRAEELPAFGRIWSVQTLTPIPADPTVAELMERPSILLPGAVLLVMLLSAGIVYMLVRQNDVIRRQVASQTAELREKNQALADKEYALNEVNKQLTEMSHTDPLTGILNRRAFEKQFDQERERSARSGVPYGLLLFDIDHFKGFNDLYGHVAGDDVLRRVAGVIRNEARRIDCVARYGGEEFVVLASGADAAGLVSLGERIRARVQEAVIENKSAPLGVITLSGGGALSSSVKGRDPRELIQVADRCLYQAKASGRNRIAMVA